MNERKLSPAAEAHLDYIGGRYPNETGKYIPDDSLEPVERAAVGTTAARLHIHLHNIFVCRESLEIAAGALQRALVVSRQADVPEKYRMFEIRSIIDIARSRILDLRNGKLENNKSKIE